MAFQQCTKCSRYYNAAREHVCTVQQPAEKKRFEWRRPWHVETSADRRIAKKFAKTKTLAMF